MATIKITKEELKKLIMEEINKDSVLIEIFGFGKKKEKIKIDNVIGEKDNDDHWNIYTGGGLNYEYPLAPTPNLYFGDVKIFPDGLMIFTYYDDGKGIHSKSNKKQFKITNIERAVQYVVDKLKEKAKEKEEKRRVDAEVAKKAEREYSGELN